ncbi:MAG TPA: hypothetical protein DFI01_06260 [Bacteroidales bacterium]|nr:hypothetical protein [Bacteroidales bacterium]
MKKIFSLFLVFGLLFGTALAQKKQEEYPWKFEEVKGSTGSRIVSVLGNKWESEGVNVIWDIENVKKEDVFAILVECCFSSKGWKVKPDEAALAIEMKRPGATASIAVISFNNKAEILGNWFWVEGETAKYSFKSPQTHGKNFFNELFGRVQDRLKQLNSENPEN